MKRFVLYIIAVLSFSNIIAQDLMISQWKNRLILIYTDSTTNEKYLEQLSVFKTNTTGLFERKVKIYKFLPTYYIEGLENNKRTIYTEFNNTSVDEKQPFTVQLIGLDGGVKMTSKSIVTFEDLKILIDGMPMRKLELDKKMN